MHQFCPLKTSVHKRLIFTTSQFATQASDLLRNQTARPRRYRYRLADTAEDGLKACRCYALTAAEIALMWQTAPPRMPIPPPAT
jgi:hypothetical protein